MKEMLCYDAITGRSFETSFDKFYSSLEEAYKHLNEHGEITLDKFYTLLGFEENDYLKHFYWVSPLSFSIHLKPYYTYNKLIAFEIIADKYTINRGLK